VDGFSAAFLVGAILAAAGVVATLTMIPPRADTVTSVEEATEPAAA
jgi:hypothetical protein